MTRVAPPVSYIKSRMSQVSNLVCPKTRSTSYPATIEFITHSDSAKSNKRLFKEKTEITNFP